MSRRVNLTLDDGLPENGGAQVRLSKILPIATFWNRHICG